SDDAEALALINDLLNRLTEKTMHLEVITLRNANAVSVAKILNETFNGPRDPSRKTERVRILADSASNALLVQATALDMVTIRRLLEQALDAPGAEVAIRTRLLGPFRNATAADVAKVVNAIYANENVVITADAKTNTLVLRCSEPAFRDIEQLVKMLDTK